VNKYPYLRRKNAMVAVNHQMVRRSTFADQARAVRGAALKRVRDQWQVVQPLVEQTQTALEKFEREQLDPVLDWLLDLWGDQRAEQRQAMGVTTTAATELPAESQINRGLYVSIGSLGLALIGTFVFPPLRLLSLPGLIYGSLHAYKQAWRALKDEHRVNVNVLTALVNTAYIGGGYLVLGNLTIAAYFASLRWRNAVEDRCEQALMTTFTQHPQLVWVLVDGQEVQTWLETLKPGDIVVVQAGETIPVDGAITAGSALVDQHILTGEALPSEKSAGAVFAGTLVLAGKIWVTAEKIGAETTVAKIGQILAHTVDARTTHELRAYQLTDRLVLPILGLSALTWPLLGPIGAAAVIDAHPHRHLNNLSSLSILNFLLLATKRGILVKDGRSLELLSQVDTLVFDKTGTLTAEQPCVIAIHLGAAYATTYSSEQLLLYAAAAEQRQSHPIASAFLAAAQSRQLPLPPVDHTTYKIGYGLSVLVDQHTVHIGSARYMDMEALAIPPDLAQLHAVCQQMGNSLVWVAIDQQVVGAIELQAVLRPEARAVLATLRQQPHIRSIVMLSGDQSAPTQRLAAELDVPVAFADVLPADKAQLIARLQQDGRKVCFIGDGLNDALALKQADVSISLRGATTAALDTAQIVLMDASLRPLIPLFELVQEFAANQRITALAVLTPGAVGLVGIFFFGFGLAQMALLDLLDLGLGTTVAMQPWLQQSRLDSRYSSQQEAP
jgi:heavy metal translocating P-type ATPase